MSLPKLTLRILLAMVGLFVFTAFCGFLFNSGSILYYRHKAGIPGRLYNVDGFKMHMYCTGKGSPVLVMDAGLGDDFLTWAKIQPQLSLTTRVCSYDRAGFGWSSQRPNAQDALAISYQLHSLVRAAAIPRPFILVGHSIAGIYMRAYAARYRDDLDGLVFLDGATPLQVNRVPDALVAIQKHQRQMLPWQKMLMEMGWYRIRGMCMQLPLSEGVDSNWIKADTCVPSQINAIENEIDAERASGEETVHLNSFGNLPILVLSRDPESVDPSIPAPVSRANSVIWNRMQEEENELSRDSCRVIAIGSGHYIQDERPELVVNEIRGFLNSIQRKQPLSCIYLKQLAHR